MLCSSDMPEPKFGERGFRRASAAARETVAEIRARVLRDRALSEALAEGEQNKAVELRSEVSRRN